MWGGDFDRRCQVPEPQELTSVPHSWACVYAPQDPLYPQLSLALKRARILGPTLLNNKSCCPGAVNFNEKVCMRPRLVPKTLNVAHPGHFLASR